MKSLPKHFFGPSGIPCLFSSNSSGETSVGYLVKQLSQYKFVVSDGNITQNCILANTLTEVANQDYLPPGTMTILVNNGGTIENAKQINATKCTTVQGSLIKWTLSAQGDGGIVTPSLFPNPPVTSSIDFSPVSGEGMSFTNIHVTEADVPGSTLETFTDSPGNISAGVEAGYMILQCAGGNFGVYYANSQQVLNITYTADAGSSLIESVGQQFEFNSFSGPGQSLKAIETITSAAGVVLSRTSYSAGVDNNLANPLSVPQHTVNVHVAVAINIDSTGNFGSAITLSGFMHYFKIT